MLGGSGDAEDSAYGWLVGSELGRRERVSREGRGGGTAVSADIIFFFFKQKTAYEFLPSLVGSEMCIRRQSLPRFACLSLIVLGVITLRGTEIDEDASSSSTSEVDASSIHPETSTGLGRSIHAKMSE